MIILYRSISSVSTCMLPLRARLRLHDLEIILSYALDTNEIYIYLRMRPALYERFNQVYTNPPNTVVSIDDVHFVLINSMAMEGDQCTICKSAQADITHIAKRLMCAKDRKSCKNNTKPVNGTYSQPILLQVRNSLSKSHQI